MATASLRYDDHRQCRFAPGETVATALLTAGVLATSRSVKYRRPRGPFCLTGDCGTCLARIDGVPNIRTCLTAARDGMQVEPQNRLGPSGLDATALADRTFGAAFDHHHFLVRPRVANRAMQAVARHLAGLGRLPDPLPPTPAAPRHHRPDVLIVGYGSAGRAAHEILSAAGLDVLVCERRPPAGDPSPGVLRATGVFGAYHEDGCWVAHQRLHPREAPQLHVITPRHVLVTTGARDPTIAVPNNDLPGVLAARGVIDLTAHDHVRPGQPLVLIGSGPAARACGESLAVEALEPGRVATLEGRNRVEAVRMSDGSRRPAALVVFAAPPTPAFELAVQAGARTHWDGSGFAVARDASGRCAVMGTTAVWAAGDVAGYGGPAAAADDGRRVARAVVNS